jgi:molecular chaperone HtpG
VIEEVFENLVEQFSDPFTFYRELIQNAMDAGSNQVDVRVEYLEDRSMVLVTVRDAGEGMTEAIINDQLTRFFASTKEQDLTKIGKFGIGFASVFALRPELVMVDTGRAGEFWRVVFQGTTDYKLFRITDAVEGTVVKLYKKLDPMELETFTQRSRETIAHWCRYSDTQISFNGELINLPLEVDSVCQAVHSQPGTTVAVGFTAELPGAYGLYNRGLTLKEGSQEEFPGITFRVKSHYLEHTLTRDNVLQDDNYFKAMAIVRKCVRETLVVRFFEQANDILADYANRREELEALFTAAIRVVGQWRTAIPRKFWGRPLFPQHQGPPLSLLGLRDKAFWEGAIYLDFAGGRVSQELHRFNVPVIWADPEGSIGRMVAAVSGKVPRSATASVAAPVIEAQSLLEPRDWDTFCSHIYELLRLGTNTVGSVALANFDYPGSSVAHLPCLAQPRADEPVRLFGRGFWRSLQLSRGRLLLNSGHPLIHKALRLAGAQPALSAFVVAKAVLLNDGLPQDLEAKIVNRCWGYQ